MKTHQGFVNTGLLLMEIPKIMVANKHPSKGAISIRECDNNVWPSAADAAGSSCSCPDEDACSGHGHGFVKDDHTPSLCIFRIQDLDKVTGTSDQGGTAVEDLIITP